MIALKLASEFDTSEKLAAARSGRAAGDDNRVTEPVQELRRWLAEEADAAGVVDDLRDIWPGLMNGEAHIVDTFYSPTRWFLVLQRGTFSALPEHVRTLLQHSLLEDSQKRAALECGMAGSTLSTNVAHALKSRGLVTSPAKAPPMLALAALVDVARTNLVGRKSSLRLAGEVLCVYSVERPEGALAPRLSAAELAVLLRVVEGWSYARIAAERRTSCRTVANQVGHAFSRLRVSGRGQLIGLLLCAAVDTPLALRDLLAPLDAESATSESPREPQLCQSAEPRMEARA
jgi:DNA-binding CsgD family transcriptional regulator